MKYYTELLINIGFFLLFGQLFGQHADSIPPIAAPMDSLRVELITLQKKLAAQQDTLREYEATIRDYGMALQAEQQQSESIANHTKEDTLSFLRQFIKQVLTQDRPDFSVRISAFQNSFDAYIVDTRKRQVRLYLYDQEGRNYKSLKNLKEDLENRKMNVHFATNGGMYTPGLAPQGLYIEDGKMVRPLDTLTEGYGNFYLQPNGVFYLTKEGGPGIVTSEMYDTISQEISYATQSGPMLVINGEHHPIFTEGSKNKYVRSGVGLLDEHHLVFIISKDPVNFHDFASVFVDYFQCDQALYLDGAISQTYQPDLIRMQLGGPFGPIIGVTSK